jgi:signal transduction histidine kinase
MQIRTRITLWFSALTAFLLLGSLLFIYTLFFTHTENAYFNNLKTRAVMAIVMLEKNNPGFRTPVTQSENYSLLPEEENILVYNLSGEKLFSISNGKDIPSQHLDKIRQNKEYRFTYEDTDYIGIQYVASNGQKWLIIAAGNCDSAELAWLSRILIITFIVFVIILSVTGYYFSGSVLHPINQTMNEIDSIKPTDLSKRLKIGENNDEMHRLALTFNRLLDQIEEAFRIQKGFLSNFSHEVRNPIGSIIANIQLSLSRERKTDDYKQSLHAILQEALELENTSFQLMELARLTAKTNPLMLQNVRLDEVVWQAKATVRKLHPDFHFKFDDSRFPTDERGFNIIGNEALLKSAFINLLDNACKFSPDHTAFISVFEENDREVCIQIIDTAHTLSQQEKEWIFKPFYRTEQAKNVQGSGIGLSLVHSIIHLHNARLTIQANEGNGNIFSIFFTHSFLNQQNGEV